jgi:catechol 2,3-dioxygenase-like lactoylglutathione lyase family enzyme
MIHGAQVVIYTKNAEAARAFFRDPLHFPSVDRGHGGLIFAMPPLEAAFHDARENEQHQLYFMCDDMDATREDLPAKKVEVSGTKEERWGRLATWTLSGGGRLGIYEPKHRSLLRLNG